MSRRVPRSDICRSASSEQKSDLRLILLGGDCADNNYASSIILRSDQKEMNNPKKGNIREGTVDGRRVSVFVAPSYWMNHLASYWIFSNAVESIRHEIQNCTSLMFPGPHAFLLVMRVGHSTGKEHFLLKAITHVFGAEALQYSMVLFIYGNEWENPRDALKDRCVKMCETRYYILENSDKNVDMLFGRVKAMTHRKQSSIFIQQYYENLMKVCFEPWERAQVNKETELKRELEEIKTCLRDDIARTEHDTLRQTELRKELEESRHHESALQEDLDKAGHCEKQLRRELEESRCHEKQLRKEVEESRCHESALQEELGKAGCSEKQLRKELEESRRREKQLRKEVEESRHHESALQEELDKAGCSEKQLRKELEESRRREKQLRKELEESRRREKQLRKELEESRRREKQLRKEVEESRHRENALQEDLDKAGHCEKQLSMELSVLKSSEVRQWKTVRRNSKEPPPKMTENQKYNTPLDNI